MSDTKIDKRFVYDGFGFDVVFRNVPMVKVRGAWTPKLDYNKLSRELALALARKPARLTGAEIRFIRHYFEMTLESFGKRFDVSHPAVMKWEGAGGRVPALKWPVEKDMRLFVLDQLHVRASEFKIVYESLREEAKPSGKPIEMDVAHAA
jgi:hypothetical protein